MTWATFCVVFLLFNVLPSSQTRRDAAVWSESVPIREDVSVGSTVYSITHGTTNVVHVWLTRDPSWVVDPTDTGTYWSPLIGPDPLPGQSVDNWYIALDLAAPRTLNSIAVNKYGDTVNDIAAFTLQKSQVGNPYSWEDVTSVDNEQGGTAQRQEFGGFQGTARYWKFLITRTHSGLQPYLTELNLYGIGISSEFCGVGDGTSYRGTVSETETGRKCQRWDSQTPQEHDRTSANYPSSGLEQNYCRNPAGLPNVWCYTADPRKRWEYCDVPLCDMMPYTVKHQRDFINVSADFIEEAENGTSIWSLNITKGNDFGRFDVVAETLSIIVTSPLDYEFHSRYNLSLELKNTADNSVWQVNLAILVMDVTGYPPYYNKRCETPVIPDDGTAENYVVMSTMGHLELNGVSSGRFLDIFSYLRQEFVDAIMSNCSLRLCAALSSDIFLLALRRSENRRTGIEWQCRDKEMRSNGRLVGMLNKRYDTLPEWADSGQCFTAESFRYVDFVVLFEVWSAPINWIQCGANVTFFDGNTQFVEFTFQSTIIGCPEGRYGLYCDKDCVCKNGARCHGFNGACECRPGWRGRACDIPWPEVVIIASPGDSVVKYIGANLTLTCLAPHIHVVNMTWIYKAEIDYNDTKLILNDTKEKGVFVVQNNSIRFKPILESSNGEYICVVQGIDGTVVNATFVLNATKCPPNYYGEVCSEKCDCQYGGTCDRWEGCLCPPGRHGDRCEHTCAPGSFGLNCSRNCNCQNNASCDPVNGTCFCAEGQSGEFCENAPKPENNQVVVIVLASVIPAMIILVGSIVIVMLVRRRLETKYTGVDTEMDILSSWEIDKEDISFEHMIGEGEFGHVVRGRLRVPAGYQVLVAAKSIRPDRMTALAVRDFRREMDILARLHEDREGHPNVVKFYGVLTKSEPQYIVVEYATNEELRRYLWSLREEYKVTGHRKLLERLRFASGVASGLSELARLKIVHRDIAARNIVISDRKVAKIADFGLSRDVYVSSAYKRTNQGGEEELLPLKWMALESLRDGVYTCESDVWSYGVLLWEIASFGEEPRYAGGPMHPDVCTLLELLQKGVRLQQSKDCPLSVYRIIRCCWIVDPSKRPTPEELLQKIDQLMPRRDASQS